MERNHIFAVVVFNVEHPKSWAFFYLLVWWMRWRRGIWGYVRRAMKSDMWL